jgi:hypothetical protein
LRKKTRYYTTDGTSPALATCIEMENPAEAAFVKRHGIMTRDTAMCPHYAELTEAQRIELTNIRYGCA